MGEMAEMYDYVLDEEFEHEVQCKYCKRWGFYWVQLSNGSWRLETPRGKTHKCKAYAKAKQKPDTLVVSGFLLCIHAQPGTRQSVKTTIVIVQDQDQERIELFSSVEKARAWIGDMYKTHYEIWHIYDYEAVLDPPVPL